MFVWAEKLSYMEQSQNKSIKAVSDMRCREKLLIIGINVGAQNFISLLISSLEHSFGNL